MAQTGYTPILIYSSSTVGNSPAAGNLTNSTLGSELAINITDGKLFYKDNANAVQVIGWKVTPTSAGGTGLTSYTAGDMLYYASGTALSKLAIGATGRWLGSSGTAPQWNAPAALTKTDDTNVTLTLGGSASTALLNAASLTLGWTGTLAVSRGGTGTGTAFTAGSVVFAGASGVYSQDNANFFWDSTNKFLGIGTATPDVTLRIKAANVPGKGQIVVDSTGYAQWTFYNGATQYFQMYADCSGGNAGAYFGTTTAQALNISVNNTNPWTFDTAYNLVPKVAAKGINFTANTAAAGMTSQLLNWYEEGTFTVSFVPSTSGTITMSTNTLTYTRIGRTVTINGLVKVSSVSSPVGYLKIQSLPYAGASGAQSRTAMSIVGSGLAATMTTSLNATVQSDSTIYVFKYDGAGGVSNCAQDIQANSEFFIGGTYIV